MRTSESCVGPGRTADPSAALGMTKGRAALPCTVIAKQTLPKMLPPFVIPSAAEGSAVRPGPTQLSLVLTQTLRLGTVVTGSILFSFMHGNAYLRGFYETAGFVNCFFGFFLARKVFAFLRFDGGSLGWRIHLGLLSAL